MNNYLHVKLTSTTQLAIVFLWLLLSTHVYATPLPTISPESFQPSQTQTASSINVTDATAVMKQALFGAGAPDSRPDIFQRLIPGGFRGFLNTILN